ncbi:hypothetical protein NPIL_489141 [Nephila pilipes]|uniref:Uncharacterized protein n=4 Tax=Nephila pilipes TaxID=299642 RepID=A0A8X6JIL2_NEPPI|nr:hypothetical protein NPIL_489141 [Nephila pilipes]
METVLKDRKQLRRLFTIACNSFDKAENQLSCVDKINKLKLIEEKALLMMACEEKFKQLLYSENTSDTEIEREVDESETYIDRWRSLKQKLESFVIEQLSSKNESFNIVTNTLLNYPKIKLPTFDEKIRFPRYFGSEIASGDISVHIFCDASKHAYAVAAFIRIQTCDSVKVQLIQARSRVAPTGKEGITISRLE